VAGFVDIEAELRTWFIAGGMTAKISTRKPDGDKAVAWLQIARIGGPVSTLVTEAPQLEISGWGDTDELALNTLNQGRRLLLPAAITADAPFIWADEFGGPVNLPDPTLPEQSRYTANWTLWTRF
jgi:hypothetical protein